MAEFIKVDALGDACPLPVVKAKKAISELQDAAYNNLGEVRDLEATVNAGFANQQTCCCETQKALLENRYLAAQNTLMSVYQFCNGMDLFSSYFSNPLLSR